MCETVKVQLVITGILFVLLAIPSYNILPSFITSEMNKLSGGKESPMADQILSELHIPPVDTIAKYIKYSCIGFGLAGLGIIAYGAISKRISGMPAVKLSIDASQRVQDGVADKLHKDGIINLSIDAPQRVQDDHNTNIMAIRLLQERLAKGEITSNQYQILKKMLETNSEQ